MEHKRQTLRTVRKEPDLQIQSGPDKRNERDCDERSVKFIFFEQERGANGIVHDEFERRNNIPKAFDHIEG